MMHDMMGGGMMWGMGRPGLLIIIVLVLAAETRRQTGSAPRAGISSTGPSLRSLPTTLWAAPPFRLGASSMAQSSRCEAADRSTSWVSVSFIGISVRLKTASRAVTTEAPHGRESRRGTIPGASMALYEPQQ